MSRQTLRHQPCVRAGCGIPHSTVSRFFRMVFRLVSFPAAVVCCISTLHCSGPPNNSLSLSLHFIIEFLRFRPIQKFQEGKIALQSSIVGSLAGGALPLTRARALHHAHDGKREKEGRKEGRGSRRGKRSPCPISKTGEF